MKIKIITAGIYFIVLAALLGIDFYSHPESCLHTTRYAVFATLCLCIYIFMIVLFELMKRKTGREILSIFKGIWGYTFILSLVWTLLIVISLVWNNNRQHNQMIEIASIEAETIYDRDKLFYRWAMSHQGVFVPITEKNQPSDYLDHLPEYIIKTTDNTMLTLVNPEYLIRQVYELQSKKNGPIGHITSLDPIRAENLADHWESGALKAFERGVLEFSEVQLINDQPYLRFMKPMITEQGCLRCHAVQGYELGDVRGGISVSIPLTPLEEIYDETIIVYALVHLCLWLLGLAGIFYGSSSISRSISRLQEAESNTRAVLENMMDGVITLDAEGNITSLNNAALTMFGYSMDEARSMHMRDLLSDEEDHQAEYNELLSCLLEPERGDAPILCHSRELEGRRNNGSLFPLEVNSNSMWMGTQRIVLVMVRDITERKKAQEVLLSSQKQAVRQEKLVSLGTMAAGIAHEIKNPAQAIAFSMEGLRMNVGYIKEFISSLAAYFAAESTSCEKDKDKLRDEYNDLRMDLVLKGVEDVVDRNVSSIERIDRIINSTKRMANSHEVFRSCDINAIIHDAAILTRNHVKYKTRVELNLADDLPRINGLSQDLGQVFINLILNAMDAIVEKGMSAKEGLIRIISRLDEESGQVEVSVTDNGVGIDSDNLGKIFDPFFSTKTVGQGMGLGLNICHRIIEAHGGELLVESTPGKGTVFIVRIDQVPQ